MKKISGFEHDNQMEHAFAVIMAGGVGSRFWPTSRAGTPKQLLDLCGGGQTMIAATVERLQPDIPQERIIVVTGEITKNSVALALPQLPPENILAEPVGRNTAPCIGWAALHVRHRDRDGVLVVLPSDHMVADKSEFLRAIRLAVGVAAEGFLVTFGVKPDRPETGFGYIEVADETKPQVRRVKRFVEKPDLATAKTYVAAGDFLWNSGMFFFRANTILDEIGRQLPELKTGLDAIDASIDSGDEIEAVSRLYPGLPSKSVDYGIMEGALEIMCVPVDFGWSDLGSWTAAYDLSRKDPQGNATPDDAILVSSRGNMVRVPEGKLVALVGVEDLVVIDSEDALLVCRKDQAQEVNKVVSELRKRNRRDLL